MTGVASVVVVVVSRDVEDVDAVVDVLVRRDALDREFFEALAVERPRRGGEIENVRRLFQG